MFARNFFRLVRSSVLFGALVLCSFSLVGCEPPWPKCDNDKNCRPDKEGNTSQKQYFCIQGTCQECRTARDCGNPERQKCEGYRCVEKTCADVICPGGKRCDPATLRCKWICEQDGETPCDGDRCKVCRNHQCEPRPPKCTNDNDCPAQQICKDPGGCDARCESGCSASKPCGAGFECKDGQCIKIACEPEKIFFNFNRSFIRNDAKEALRRNLDCFSKQPDKKILIEGHCDERGTREYNIQLGKRRSRSAKRFLEKLGIKRDRICTVSKGKEEPEVSNASTDEQHQRNRRGVFKFVDGCP